ncbi:MAG: hypothetical protein LC099_12740 [Anaerolineales bacterium]|nr:hypothetical protein [Anaerolineales bacterium]
MFDIKSNSQSSNNNNDREPSALWLNIGIEHTFSNGEKRFVSLPLGIPFDSLNVKPYKGSNVEYAEFNSVQAALVEAIREQFTGVPQGESRRLESKNLIMELRHAGGQSEAAPVPQLNLQFKLK